MGKIKDIARITFGANGQYISLDELTKRFPEGVTICGACVLNLPSGEANCFKYAEETGNVFPAMSRSLAELWDELMDYSGTVEAMDAEVHEEPIKILIKKIYTKTKKPFWKVSLIEED